jgi:hypothetical protein
MKYDWKNNGRIEQALSEGITNQYHPTKRLGGVYSAQGISNIIYFLGELFKERKDGYNIYFSMDVLESFWNGIEKCSNDFHGQSVAMVIYGSVSFFCLSAFCFSCIILDCHNLTLNGINYQFLFVRVSKNQSGNMKTSLLFNRFVMFYQGDLSFFLFRCIIFMDSLSTIFSRCSVVLFSLGTMGASWKELPFKNTLYSEVERLLTGPVTSQFCCSVIYGYLSFCYRLIVISFLCLSDLLYVMLNIRLYQKTEIRFLLYY